MGGNDDGNEGDENDSHGNDERIRKVVMQAMMKLGRAW